MDIFQLVNISVKNDADVNQSRENGVTPLFISAENEHFPIVEYLMLLSIKKMNVVSLSAQEGHFPIVEYFGTK